MSDNTKQPTTGYQPSGPARSNNPPSGGSSAMKPRTVRSLEEQSQAMAWDIFKGKSLGRPLHQISLLVRDQLREAEQRGATVGKSGEAVYQWRPASGMPWHDCSKEQQAKEAALDYETRVLYAAPQSDAQAGAPHGLDATVHNILRGFVATFDALNTAHSPDEESAISDMPLRDERDGFAIEALWQLADQARAITGAIEFRPLSAAGSDIVDPYKD